jgi:hypothetical protein
VGPWSEVSRIAFLEGKSGSFAFPPQPLAFMDTEDFVWESKRLWPRSDQNSSQGENIRDAKGSSGCASTSMTSALRGQRLRNSWHIGLASLLLSKIFCRV